MKAAVSKTVNGGFVVRGFESLPLRSFQAFRLQTKLRLSRDLRAREAKGA